MAKPTYHFKVGRGRGEEIMSEKGMQSDWERPRI